eukprot:4314687-Prymnesium_polylepis.1
MRQCPRASGHAGVGVARATVTKAARTLARSHARAACSRLRSSVALASHDRSTLSTPDARHADATRHATPYLQ